jgi:hypothetical protein
MLVRVGTCSLCGGDVMGFEGSWSCILPPPPNKCSRCGAIEKGDIIEMVKSPDPSAGYRYVTISNTVTNTDGKDKE